MLIRIERCAWIGLALIVGSLPKGNAFDHEEEAKQRFMHQLEETKRSFAYFQNQTADARKTKNIEERLTAAEDRIDRLRLLFSRVDGLTGTTDALLGRIEGLEDRYHSSDR